MKLAIMQPYFFPYFGYFQLVAAVDKFVFYDDVNFIKNGWINRNRLRLSGAVRYFTIPLSGASPSRSIAEAGIQPGRIWKRKMLDSVRQSYSKAPHVSDIVELMSAVLDESDTSVAEVAKRSVAAVSDYLRLGTDFVWTSSEYANSQLRGESRVIDICNREGATHYFNLPGGRDLYNEASFERAGLQLRFVEPTFGGHCQGEAKTEPDLSILDALMWNDPEVVRQMLRNSSTV